MEKYGGESYLGTEDCKKKTQEYFRQKHGVNNPSQVETIQRKKVETCIKKYGVDSPLKSSEIRAKGIRTLRDKYGVDNPSKSEIIKDRKKKKFLAEHNVDNPLKSDIIKQKIKQTCIARYGFDNPAKSNRIKNKIRQTNIDRYGCVSSKHAEKTKEQKEILFNDDMLSRFMKNKSASEIAKTLDVSLFYVYDKIKKFELWDKIIHRCSKLEDDITSYLINLGIMFEQTRRDIISPYELDIYLPDHNIAIECNGSYWHSELNGKDKNYHLVKTKLCQEKGIHLIHIWEHDWINNPEMIKTRLKAKLGLLDKVYARNCEIKEIYNKEATEFLDKWHIQGNAPASVKYGLYYNDELVSVMTFGKSRYKKDIEWELIRYCSIKNVVGGASKLFKRFMRDHNPKSIISYSDKQWNTGDLYNNLGFTYSHSSNPSYYYTRDYVSFENRVAYQKHKLPKKLDVFDMNLTEWKNMQLNGYDRIWDCGTDVWKCFLTDTLDSVIIPH